ncbi:MAG: hypothetical protein QOE61_3664 [Micromonosporaceae bacterium]|jgi:hypothetical protein|nr:hypothetical protein [Micromonosporaceae bacterium]
MVIADDSTGRFLADRSLAGSVPHGTIVVVTVRGDLLSCHSLSAPTSADKADGTAGRRADFRTDVQKYLGRCGGIGAAAEAQADNPADVAGGWAACVYDTVRMLYEATRRVTLRNSGRLASRADIARLLTVDDPRDHHIYAGALRPIAVGADRVARTGAVLYCVPELAEAFTHDLPTAVAERRDGEDHILAATSLCDLTSGSGAAQ